MGSSASIPEINDETRAGLIEELKAKATKILTDFVSGPSVERAAMLLDMRGDHFEAPGPENRVKARMEQLGRPCLLGMGRSVS